MWCPLSLPLPCIPRVATILTFISISFSWDPIVKYIKDQHSAYLRKELTAQRDRHIQDTRIHCALFFINPTGHSLRPIDVIVMKKLSEVVNVGPVIAKSDSVTLEERDAFKHKSREELIYHNIRLYPFDTEENDEEEIQLNESIRVRLLTYVAYRRALMV